MICNPHFVHVTLVQMKEILEKAHKRDNFLQISAALLRRKTLAGKQRCEMIKAGEQKEKIVKE